MGRYLKRVTGWHALFYGCALLHLASALVFAAMAQVTPAAHFRDKTETEDEEEEPIS
jgi:hypothetical protein